MPTPQRWSFDLYSRGQQITIVLLVGACLVIAALLKFYRPAPPHFEGRDDLLAAAAQLRDVGEKDFQAGVSAPDSETFYFDPNTVSADDLQRLGLSEKQARSWIKYRGGSSNRFKKADDIAKLYVLKEDDVNRLLPLVRLQRSKADEGSKEQSRASGHSAKSNSENESTYEQFNFDPNTVTEDELMRLGLKPRQAQSFLKYRNKLSRPFRYADELDKIRVLDDAQKARLKPLVNIEVPVVAAIEETNGQVGSDPADPSGNPSITYERPVTSPVQYSAPEFELDINTATGLDLEQIPGIGPYWAKRILSFREKLGGFSSIDQIATTYGLADSTFQRMEPYLRLDTPVYRKLAVNLLTKEELAAHIYVSYKLAGIIDKFRAQHGSFRGVEDMRRIRLFTKEVEAKLAPYLDYRQ